MHSVLHLQADETKLKMMQEVSENFEVSLRFSVQDGKDSISMSPFYMLIKPG